MGIRDRFRYLDETEITTDNRNNDNTTTETETMSTKTTKKAFASMDDTVRKLRRTDPIQFNVLYNEWRRMVLYNEWREMAQDRRRNRG